jgi:hypothetical protein
LASSVPQPQPSHDPLLPSTLCILNSLRLLIRLIGLVMNIPSNQDNGDATQKHEDQLKEEERAVLQNLCGFGCEAEELEGVIPRKCTHFCVWVLRDVERRVD